MFNSTVVRRNFRTKIQTSRLTIVSLVKVVTMHDCGVLMLSVTSVCASACNAPTFESPNLGSSFSVRRYASVYLGQLRVSRSSGQGQGHGSKMREIPYSRDVIFQSRITPVL